MANEKSKKTSRENGSEFEIEELHSELEEVSGGACHCAGACSGGDCSACCKEEMLQ